MRKIKLISVAYNYDYATDETLKSFTKELDWKEVDEGLYERLSEAVKNQYKMGKESPFYGKTLLILEDLSKTPLDIDNLLSVYEELTRKEQVAAEKRKAAQLAAQKLKDQKALERKQKQLEKLKKELEDQ